MSGCNKCSRRSFLTGALTSAMMLACGVLPVAAENAPLNFTGKEVLDRILSRARQGKWQLLPMSELMGKVACEFLGTPYKAFTLELSSRDEIVSVNLKCLDCVTFFETTLALSRLIKLGGTSAADLLKQIAFLRYYGGTAGDFSTRLHYTSGWFIDNQRKGVVRLLEDLPGAMPFSPKVNFMSTHPSAYPQLSDPQLVEKIKAREEALNRERLSYVPLAKLAGVEPFLQSGDIVGVCTRLSGLDIEHTGLVLRQGRGASSSVHFMDASSRKRNMKVVIEPGPLSRAFNWSSQLTGVVFARPLEPK
ncbi:MAG: DUF1460 domain-containing protein [Candidatus Melainabacteria bacterium]|nr:DUF1460 domain-containing protein [Candidatus Melainabacteria bacterium]